ncbi:MAG: transporter substrate-binding domain-containing protein [Desulfocapsaceae bacterium]|nr:transporter substrate-binding domain-containing protein [Desulfocapsaceae bacterium]
MPPRQSAHSRRKMILAPCFLLIALILVGAAGQDACAGEVLQRVKAHGIVRCSGAVRPGLAKRDAGGHWQGIEVDVCRAVAEAVLGSADRMEFSAWDALPEGKKEIGADIAFLTGSEIADNRLAGRVLPGPVVYIESHGIMVPENSSVEKASGLSGKGICYMTGSRVEQSLEAYFDTMHQGWLRRAFSEEGEMMDAYLARNCQALAGERTALASIRQVRGVDQRQSRILPDSLVDFPVLAATGANDGQWAAIVAWTVHSLISGEERQSPWRPGGAGAMPVEAQELGLEKGWQSRVLQAVGSYGDIYERNLGRQSPLALERRLNAGHADGGLLLSPFLE